MSVLSFVVPVKPIGVNQRFRNNSTKTLEARAYSEAVAAYGLQARRRAGWQTYSGPVDVAIAYFFASNRPDADGPDKATLDALQTPNARAHRVGAGIIANDRQVRRRLYSRGVDTVHPRVEIEVGPAGEVFEARRLT